MTQEQMVLDTEVEVKKVTRQLEVPFTNIDYSEMGKEFEDITKRLVDAKTDLDKCKEEMKELQKRAEKGHKTENVTCEMRLMYKNRLVQVVHDGKVIEERAMTDSEFQQEFREFTAGDEAEEEGSELTEEEAAKDLKDVMREEKSPTKPVAT